MVPTRIEYHYDMTATIIHFKSTRQTLQLSDILHHFFYSLK